MSLTKIENVFKMMENGTDWSLQLLNFKHIKNEETSYSSRQIYISPEKEMEELIATISKLYSTNVKKRITSQYNSMRFYDGSAEGNIIYKIDTKSDLIKKEYLKFVKTISNPDLESDPLNYDSAYLLKGTLEIDNEMIDLILVSIRKPITVLKQKYSLKDGKGNFERMDNKILTLCPTINIVVIDQTMYFLNMAGETLFNMPRAYKKVCETKVNLIEEMDLIDGIDIFKNAATSGHNPRRFVSFNDEALKELEKPDVRKKMADCFSIPLNDDDQFIISDDKVANKLVKLLCNKGMLDPFNENPVEVSSAIKWE